MNESNDEKLQRLLEDGNYSSDELLNKNGEAYKLLFAALNKEPERSLPYDFAAKVTRKITAQQKQSNELKYNIVALGVFIGLMVLACAILTFYGSVTWRDVFKYKWIFLLLPLIFTLIQYFDQKLVKAKLFRNTNT